MEIHKLHLVCAEIIITQLVFYKGNVILKKANILSYGFNRMGDLYGNEAGVHAEHDAINKLKPIAKKKHLQNINILVIRFSKNNKLQQSKPCVNCIRTMKTLPEKKGYKIKNIFYSNENGEIIKSNITNLENEDLHYSRFYRRKL
jgi:cytidine deaminase